MAKIHEQITPETWCKCLMAADDKNNWQPVDAPEAIKWCSLGWVSKVYGGFSLEKMLKGIHINRKLTEYVNKHTNHRILQCFNDDPETTFEQIKEMFRTVNV